MWCRIVISIGALAVLGSLAAPSAQAIPAFARQYQISCKTCHVAFPRLNAFGESFVDMNYRLPNWREANVVETGDERLALPATPPLAFRVQAYVQQRSAEEIDPETGETGADAKTDIQSPFLIKLLSSAPLSEHISYYFYAIYAEKGANGETIVEDAWFSHDDVFGSGVGLQLGQFQISDLMFPRETRLTFQDFMAYRLAGLTYDRGVILGRGLGPVSLDVGAVNGNGIDQNFDVNSPGIRRSDRIFDNDTDKSVFGRLGVEAGPVGLGLFALSGFQRSASGPLGLESGDRDTVKRVYGLDASGDMGGEWFWFLQALHNRWEGFLERGEDIEWNTGFAGVDFVPNEYWAFSLLYNHTDPGDFEDTGTVYEGAAMQTVTLGAAYYFMTNVKGVIEVNGDLLEEDDDPDFVGHETQEHYLLLGFDAAY